jgi:MoxR-like ATPase
MNVTSTLKPSKLSEALAVLIKAGRPPFIWGAPGIGKSQIMQQVADKLFAADYGCTVDAAGAVSGVGNRPWFTDVRAVLLDPVDLRGLPHVNGGGMATWAIPDFLPQSGTGVVFLDELNRAPAMVQNACLQLVLDRRVGEYRLPDGWQVAAAGNYQDSGVSRVNSALSLRFVHLDAGVDLTDWCNWAVDHDIHPATLSFIRFRPDRLHAYDSTKRSSPNPRCWEFVSDITKQNETNGTSNDVAHQLFCGSVGEGDAVEYTAWLDMWRSMVSIDAIMLNPDTCPVPNQPGVLYATCTGLAHVATESNFGRALRYLNRMPPEFGVMAVKDITRRKPAITSTPEFTRWAITNGSLLT